MTLRGVITASLPVFGLRPTLAFLERTIKVANPESFTSPSRTKALPISSITCSKLSDYSK